MQYKIAIYYTFLDLKRCISIAYCKHHYQNNTQQIESSNIVFLLLIWTSWKNAYIYRKLQKCKAVENDIIVLKVQTRIRNTGAFSIIFHIYIYFLVTN